MGEMGRTRPGSATALRAVSVFADLNYLPSAVALINSILHFQVQARIKFYDFAGLPHLARTHLARFATLVGPPAHALDAGYYRDWSYRARILRDNLDPYELQVDADTVVLSDLESAFARIERGEMAVLREWEYDHHVPDAKGRDARHREPPAGGALHRMLRHPEIHHEGLPIYNAGLLGFHRDNHRVVVELWERVTREYDGTEGTFFDLEQNKLALIIASLLREGRVRVHELPKHLWMQTWDDHREPRKTLGFHEGRIALYNGSRENRMHFYHYTGDITAPASIAGEDGKYPVRFNAFATDRGIPDGLTQRQMIDAWNHVWRVRHESAAGELPKYFYDMGPARAPRCIDPEWRETLARLVRHVTGMAGADKDSREAWALAFAYDYIDYCGYRAHSLGWMSEPLRILLGEERLGKGERTVSWQGPADVSIDFKAAYADERRWAAADTHREHGLCRAYSERHEGVFVNIR
jgi:hypothetical protein